MVDLFVRIFLSIPFIGAFAMFALGISVIYRASRVLNLAHGAMAMVPAYVFHSLIKAHAPLVVALPLAVASGALLGVAVERVFVRRLRPQGPTAQTVGTVAVAGLLIAVAAKVWGTTPLLAPSVFPAGELRIADAAVRYGDIGLFLTGVTVSAGLFAFFRFSELGLAMRGAAQNRRAASLMGIDPDLAAAAAWALGGGLAALAGIMLAAVTTLDPYNLTLQVLPAFVAALIGGLENLFGALGGAAVAGVAFGVVPALGKIPGLGFVFRQPGSSQLLLAILAMVVMVTRGRRLSGAEASEAGLVSGGGFRSGGRRRRLGPGALVAAGAMVLFPFVAPFSFVGDAIFAFEWALVALSLVVLTGWVGQISLAQASFVGIGALVTAMVVRSWGWEFPLTLVVGSVLGAAAAALLGAVALRVRGLYLAVATLIFAWMADQFLFRSPWLGADAGASGIPNQRIGSPGGFPSLDLTSRKVIYFILLAVAVIVVSVLANLRDVKTGRAFFAVRGSEMAAASLGIDVVRTKMVAFALSGTLAGLGGSLLLTEQRTVVPAQFFFTWSLFYLSVAVVGGLGSLGGALAAGVVFAALNEVFFRVEALRGWLEVVSAGLLAFVLLAYPGGLAALPDAIRRRLERSPRAPTRDAEADETAIWGGLARKGIEEARRAGAALARVTARARGRVSAVLPPTLARARGDRRASKEAPTARAGDWYATARRATDGHETAPAEAEEQVPVVEAPLAPTGNGSGSAGGALHLGAFVPADLDLPADRKLREPLIAAEGVTVRFGGLTAVNKASLSVRRAEITGLIGPNGAGKTTLFNAILGLNDPVGGTISLYGYDVTAWPPHLRARLGIARTFQVLQLFNELTVFDNLLVATHLHNESGLISNLVGGPATIKAEVEARRRVREILEILELGPLAHEGVRNLPFGVLRMVELGRALVTGAQVMMLDEPASGLNEAETDRLMETVRSIRALGVTVLLIEHDIRMVVEVSDYCYVLDQGQVIAEGPPQQIVRNPVVIDAYLGGHPEETAAVGGS